MFIFSFAKNAKLNMFHRQLCKTGYNKFNALAVQNLQNSDLFLIDHFYRAFQCRKAAQLNFSIHICSAPGLLETIALFFMETS